MRTVLDVSRHHTVDLLGRLSNPLDITETLAAHGSQPIGDPGEGVEVARNEGPDDCAEGSREEEGRLSNPPQRRLSPTSIDDLITAYQAGTTINQLAADYGIHRTTVATHLDRHQVTRRQEQAAWDDNDLREAAKMYASGLSLAAVADRFRIDAQTVANRFRRADVRVRPRRGWPSRNATS